MACWKFGKLTLCNIFPCYYGFTGERLSLLLVLDLSRSNELLFEFHLRTLLDKAAFDKASFDSAAFDCAIFDCAIFDCAIFDKAAFDKAAFDKAAFDKAAFDRAVFDKTSFNSAAFDRAVFDKTSFNSAVFDKAAFDKTSLLSQSVLLSLDVLLGDRSLSRLSVLSFEQLKRIAVVIESHGSSRYWKQVLASEFLVQHWDAERIYVAANCLLGLCLIACCFNRA